MIKVPPYPWKFKKCCLFEIPTNKKWIFCDLLATVLASQWKQKARCCLEHAAHVLKNMPEWNEVRNIYPLSTKPYKMLPQFGNHNDEKHHLLIWFKCLKSQKITPEVFATGLASFECIQAYILNLQWYQYAVMWVYVELFDPDEELRTTIERYNRNLWDPYRIASFTLKIVFDIEDVEVPPDFAELDLDRYIYSRIKNQEWVCLAAHPS